MVRVQNGARDTFHPPSCILGKGTCSQACSFIKKESIQRLRFLTVTRWWLKIRWVTNGSIKRVCVAVLVNLGVYAMFLSSEAPEGKLLGSTIELMCGMIGRGVAE
jgi:hypothetical protein